MIRFEKVPFEEYAKSRKECFPFLEETLPKVSIDAILQHEWNNIKLPKRATSGSAGYDIFAPFDFTIPTYESCDYINRGYITLPTGIRFVTDHNDIALLVLPRSGLGFKHGTRLRNTVGLIDSDYQYAINSGHIMAKIIAEDSVDVEVGKAFMQAIIIPFITVDEDDTTNARTGGFGSTDKQIVDK